jgi:hypothetical protein
MKKFDELPLWHRLLAIIMIVFWIVVALSWMSGFTPEWSKNSWENEKRAWRNSKFLEDYVNRQRGGQ